MPVQQMHAGEELLWVVIPAFVILMIVDIVKRRKLRREGHDAEIEPVSAESSADTGKSGSGSAGSGGADEPAGERPTDSGHPEPPSA